MAAKVVREIFSRGAPGWAGPSNRPESLLSIPQKTTMSEPRIMTLTQACSEVKPPAMTVNSLMKRPKRRQSADGDAGQAEEEGRGGHGTRDAGANAAEIQGVKMLVNVAGGEEQDGLGQGVVTHVKQRAKDRQGRVHADRRADQADVFQAGIGQHPLEVLLHQDERPGQHHGKQAEAEQQVAAEPGAETGGGENVKTQQRIEGDFEGHAGEHGAGGRRRFAVRIGQPGMHRGEAGLGAVADQHQDEGQRHQAGIELRRQGQEVRPVETGSLRRRRHAMAAA